MAVIDALIHRNSDGATALHRWETTLYDNDPEAADAVNFMWGDGNYACDCNRYLFFERAVGRVPSDHYECGDSAYSLIWLKLNGEVIAEEEIPAPPSIE